jgi:ribonuclease R
MKKQENIESKIIKLFGGDKSKSFSFDRLQNLLPKTVRREKLVHALMVLKKQKRIVELEMDSFRLNPKEPEYKEAKPEIEKPKKIEEVPSKYIQKPKLEVSRHDIVEGILDIAGNGSIFVIIEGMSKDAIIRNRTVPAFSGDRIEVKLDRLKEGKRPEASFVRVIERKLKKFIGKFEVQQSKDFEVFFVQPLTERISFDFYIASKHTMEAKAGDYVEVEFIEWKDKEKNPRGQVTEILKDFNPNELEMRSILLDKGFQTAFDQKVIDELKAVPQKISDAEIKDRLDLREVMTLTIDPKTAKDFDDALSIAELEDGKFEIGVHIADVSYYVPFNSEVDQEAQRRATSVYLPDRVAPMLPELLSNDLCSLNPNVDRLAFSVMYTIDRTGKIHNEYIAKTVIHSKKRFAYEDAQKIIETGKGDFSDEVLLLWDIASTWRLERFSKGAIDFHATEVQFELDENKVPINVVQKIQKEANWLIEEFMLRANVSVAKALDGYTKAKKIPAGVYRNHDVPDMAKLEQFREAADRLGNHKLKKIDKVENAAKILNDFLHSIKENPESDILNQLAIRSMSKAYYATENIGHYGLAYSHYSHFTSPIRRYPDLMAHRLLTELLKKQKSSYTIGILDELCAHCSAQEKKATDCERDGIKFKQMEYMSTRIGEYYKGVISGMNGNGFWVELKDNKCEGFVELNKNFKETFSFDQNNLNLKSNSTQIQFHMGQTVEIKINKVELETKKAWFTIVNF